MGVPQRERLRKTFGFKRGTSCLWRNVFSARGKLIQDERRLVWAVHVLGGLVSGVASPWIARGFSADST